MNNALAAALLADATLLPLVEVALATFPVDTQASSFLGQYLPGVVGPASGTDLAERVTTPVRVTAAIAALRGVVRAVEPMSFEQACAWADKAYPARH